ncbi:MAG: hypothetical protein EBZ47_09685 [Chlamydiae bacterium]|nr:hypothetical protein [Chlamydiota bacterium]
MIEMIVEVDIESYLDNVKSLIKKRLEEGKRLIDLVCKEHLDRVLEESLYPRAEIVKIILASKDIKKVEEQVENIKDWRGLRANSSSEKLLGLLEAIVLGSYIDPSEEDESFLLKTYEETCRNKMVYLANTLEEAIHKVSWKNYRLKVVAVPHVDDLNTHEAKILVNDQEGLLFNLNNKEAKVLDSVYFKECEKIKEAISMPKKEVISTFCLENGFDKNRIESIKKEVAMGLRPYLLEGTALTKNEGSWKVKLNEVDLMKVEDKYIVKERGALIRHIEKNEKQHR